MVEWIVHSRETRAAPSAAACGEALGVPIDEADRLAPRDAPAISAARVTAETGDIMRVGHLPNLANLARLLLTGDPPGLRANIRRRLDL